MVASIRTFLCLFRPLTQEEIARRRETARQRHAERMMAGQTGPERHKDPSHPGHPDSEDPSHSGRPVSEDPSHSGHPASEDLSKGEMLLSLMVSSLVWSPVWSGLQAGLVSSLVWSGLQSGLQSGLVSSPVWSLVRSPGFECCCIFNSWFQTQFSVSLVATATMFDVHILRTGLCWSLSETLTLKESQAAQEEAPKEVFIAFARVYSRAVKKGQKVFVLGPKYDPRKGLSLVSPHSFSHSGQTV